MGLRDGFGGNLSQVSGLLSLTLQKKRFYIFSIGKNTNYRATLQTFSYFSSPMGVDLDFILFRNGRNQSPGE